MPGSTWPLPTTPLDGAVTTAWLAALTTLTVILLARPGGSARSVAAAGSGSRVRDGGGEFDDGDRDSATTRVAISWGTGSTGLVPLDEERKRLLPGEAGMRALSLMELIRQGEGK